MIKVLEWPSLRLDLNHIINLCNDLKRAVHRQTPHNLIDLEHFFKDEWNKICQSGCAKLIDSYTKKTEYCTFIMGV